ncbi:MAG: hypothetical protein GSR73_00290 [Desulfurococcales archaeon]|nr:hypothetical protein [Desulfurococcales archaeon]
MKPRMNIASRILLVIGLALLIASTISNYYGVKSEARYSGAVSVGESQGVAVYVMSMSSEGVVRIELRGVSSAYYIANVSGDVASLVQSLSVFNISAMGENLQHDVRSGLVYGYARLKTSRYLLGTLPIISKMLNFAINNARVVNQSTVVEARLEPSQSLVLIGVPSGETVYFDVDFRLTGYRRLSYAHSLLLSLLLIALSLLIGLARRRPRETYT